MSLRVLLSNTESVERLLPLMTPFSENYPELLPVSYGIAIWTSGGVVWFV